MLHHMFRAEASVAEGSDDDCETKGSEDGCDPEDCVTVIQLLINGWCRFDSFALGVDVLRRAWTAFRFRWSR